MYNVKFWVSLLKCCNPMCLCGRKHCNQNNKEFKLCRFVAIFTESILWSSGNMTRNKYIPILSKLLQNGNLHKNFTIHHFPTDRVSINQTGSLSLFSSKEQELEQRAHMLKRLAFTIYCSDPDQYQKCMPEIQGEFRVGNSSTIPACPDYGFLCLNYIRHCNMI